MAEINWEQERRRLTALYSTMDDRELEKIGRNLASLTDVARQILANEMSKRGMALPAEQASPPRAQMPRPVILRRYRDLPEATIAKSILDSAGIECFLADDNVVRMDWFFSNALGRVKLLVRDEDAEVAGKLLDSEVPETFHVDGVGEYQQPRCPQCGSLDVSFDGLDKRTSYASLVISIPIPVVVRDWKCHDCGHAWKDEAIESAGDSDASDEKHGSNDQEPPQNSGA